MSNALYLKARQNLLEGNINLLTETVKAVLLDESKYTPDIGVHAFLSDIPSDSIIGEAQTLTNKSVTDGAFDADDPLFVDVEGESAELILLYLDSGNAATSRLLYLIDVAVGLPVVPNGGAITVQWDNGPAKIFAL